jgi:hypothetical protein
VNYRKLLTFLLFHSFLFTSLSCAENEIAPENITAKIDKDALYVGDTAQISVTAHYSDGSTKNVTSGSHGTRYLAFSEYLSIKAELDISSDGKVKVLALDKGESRAIELIVLLHKGRKQVVGITILADSAIRVEAPKTRLKVGEKVQLKVWKTLKDGTKEDVTSGKSGTKYTSTGRSSAKVNPDGLVEAIGTLDKDSYAVGIMVRHKIKGKNERDEITIEIYK